MPSEFHFKVASYRTLTPTVFELTFESELPFQFKAGQFVSVVVPGAGPNGRDLRRAYSIASAPEARPVELCVKLVDGGPGTNYLAKLRPGDTFRAYAPYGDFIYKPKPGRHAIFIATGTGIAPFRSMVFSKEYQASPPASATCLMGVHCEPELLYMDDFAAQSRVKWVPMVSKPQDPSYKGYQGRVTKYLRELGGDFPWLETEYYLCGNGAMIDEVKAILTEKGVQKTSIHQEIYYKPPKPKADGGAAVSKT